MTDMTYQMRLALDQGIYEWKNVKIAHKQFGNGCARVGAIREPTGALHGQMARVARMIEGHLVGILAQWAHGRTTAIMEELNSLFSAVKRKARGYRTVE